MDNFTEEGRVYTTNALGRYPPIAELRGDPFFIIWMNNYDILSCAKRDYDKILDFKITKKDLFQCLRNRLCHECLNFPIFFGKPDPPPYQVGQVFKMPYMVEFKNDNNRRIFTAFLEIKEINNLGLLVKSDLIDEPFHISIWKFINIIERPQLHRSSSIPMEVLLGNRHSEYIALEYKNEIIAKRGIDIFASYIGSDSSSTSSFAYSASTISNSRASAEAVYNLLCKSREKSKDPDFWEDIVLKPDTYAKYFTESVMVSTGTTSSASYDISLTTS